MSNNSTIDVLGRTLKSSVQFNGLLIPFISVESTLARYTQPLIAWNSDPTYCVSVIGSGIAIHYRDEYFLLCCRHQIKGRPFDENIGLLDKDGKDFYGSGGMQYFDNVNDIELNDLVALRLTEACNARPSRKERFLNLTSAPPDARSDEILFWGCPR